LARRSRPPKQFTAAVTRAVAAVSSSALVLTHADDAAHRDRAWVKLLRACEALHRELERWRARGLTLEELELPGQWPMNRELWAAAQKVGALPGDHPAELREAAEHCLRVAVQKAWGPGPAGAATAPKPQGGDV
jgi:hypothetical protein